MAVSRVKLTPEFSERLVCQVHVNRVQGGEVDSILFQDFLLD